MADAVSFSPTSTPNTPDGVDNELTAGISRNINDILSILESPSTASPSLKSTPPGLQLDILKGVVAYVEVRSKHENRSHVIEKELWRLGATVVPKLGPEVTHVVFKEGNKSTRDRALKKGIHLVSVLWVDSCKQNAEHMAESAFPVHQPDTQKQPLYFQQKQIRMRKFKSMQPKDFEEEVIKSAERGEKLRRRRFLAAEKLKLATPTSPLLHRVYVEETQPRSPLVRGSSPNLVIPDTPPNMRDALSSLSRMKHPEQDVNTPLNGDRSPPPLQRRLFAGLSPFTPSKVTSPQSSPMAVCHTTSSSGRSSPQVATVLHNEDPLSASPVTTAATRSSPRGVRRSRSSTSNQPSSPSVHSELLRQGRSPVVDRQLVENSTTAQKPSSEIPSVDQTTVKAVGRRRSVGLSKHRRSKASPMVETELAAPVNPVCPVGAVPDIDTDLSASRASSPVPDLPQDAEPCITLVAVEPAKTSKKGRRKTMGSELLARHHVVLDNSNVRKSRRRSAMVTASAACHKFDAITSPDRAALRTTSQTLTPAENDKLQDMSTEKNTGRESLDNCVPKSTPDSASDNSLRGKRKRPLLPLDHGLEPAMLVSPVLSSNTKQSMEKLYSPKKSKAHVKKKSGEKTLKELKAMKRKSDEISGNDSDASKVKPKLRKQDASKSELTKPENFGTVPLSGSVNSNKTEKQIEIVKPKAVTDKVLASVKRRRSVRLSVGTDIAVPVLNIDECRKSDSKSGAASVGPPADKLDKVASLEEVKKSASAITLPAKQVTSLQNSRTTDTPTRRRSMRRSILSAAALNVDTPTLSQVEKSSSRISEKFDTVVSVSEKCPADFDTTLEESLHEKVTGKKRKKKSSSHPSVRAGAPSSANISSDSGMSEMDDTASTLSSQISVVPAARSRLSIDEFKAAAISLHTSETHTDAQTSLKKESVRKTSKVRSHSISMVASELDCTTDNNRSVQAKGKSRQKSGSSGCESDKRRQSKMQTKVQPSIVMTSLHSVEQDTVRSIVKSLGTFVLENTVSPATTHIVCGNNRRTLNTLYAIAHGCWLLSLEWVLKSVEAKKWLEEEEYELNDYFPAAQQSRMERIAAGDDYKQDLFSSEGFIFVSEQTQPPYKHLVKLLQLCGAKVTQCLRKADLCVGANAKRTSVVVSEQWVLDSITSHQCLPHDQYIIGGPGFQRSPSPDF